MPTPGTAKWPKPKSEDEFEDIVLDALKIRWGDPNATRNGRRGQRQNGVDICGKANHRGGEIVGAQCKNTESPTIKHVVEEVGKAMAFKPALTEFLFVTASDRDSTLQEAVRLHFERAPVPFTVELMFWDDLIHEMNGHGHLFEKHWPIENQKESSSGDASLRLTVASRNLLDVAVSTSETGGSLIQLLTACIYDDPGETVEKVTALFESVASGASLEWELRRRTERARQRIRMLEEKFPGIYVSLTNGLRGWSRHDQAYLRQTVIHAFLRLAQFRTYSEFVYWNLHLLNEARPSSLLPQLEELGSLVPEKEAHRTREWEARVLGYADDDSELTALLTGDEDSDGKRLHVGNFLVPLRALRGPLRETQSKLYNQARIEGRFPLLLSIVREDAFFRFLLPQVLCRFLAEDQPPPPELCRPDTYLASIA